MSKRTGSYPYMNLAADLGVAYGDVLLWAEHVEQVFWDEQPVPWGRRLVAEAAAKRL